MDEKELVGEASQKKESSSSLSKYRSESDSPLESPSSKLSMYSGSDVGNCFLFP